MNNEHLYKPLTTITTARGGQEWYLSRFPMRGAERLNGSLWGYRRFGTAKVLQQELYVPGDSQNNRVRIALDGGGHICEWDLTVDGVTKQLFNHQGGYGRGMQHAIFFGETLHTLPIVSITKGNPTLVKVRFPHGAEIGTKLNVLISGVNVLTPDINGGYGPTATGFGTGNPAEAYDSGSDYSLIISLPVDTSATVGTYSGGTLALRALHNPTQGGSHYSTDPVGAGPDEFTTCDGMLAQGSPIIDVDMRLLARNQGYIKTVCVPLEWSPDDPNYGHYHGGNKYWPVIWDGITMTTEWWINYQGVEGVHKFTQTTTLHDDLYADSTISNWMGTHTDWGMGVGSGNPRFRAHRVTNLTPWTTDVFGTGGRLENTAWPFGGTYVDTTLGYSCRTGFSLTYRSDDPLTTTSGIFPDVGASIFGGLASVGAPDDSVFCGFWNLGVVNETLGSFSWWPVVLGSGYGKNAARCTQLAAWHGTVPKRGVIKAGNHSTTTWFLTGRFSDIGNASTGLLNKMITNSWW